MRTQVISYCKICGDLGRVFDDDYSCVWPDKRCSEMFPRPEVEQEGEVSDQ